MSTLTFTIDNGEFPTTASALAFTDALPAGMAIAAPANASTTCTNGVVTAPDGGTTITFSNGQVPANGSCSISVNVTSGSPGGYVNVSGALASDKGAGIPAQATLTVDVTRPGFTKSFSPSMITVGGQSTLTFTIDNSGGSNAITVLSFTDTLPAGLVIATISNAITTCQTPPSAATLTATPGTNTISINYFGSASLPAVSAGSSCTVSVDVTATIAGRLGNVSGELSTTNSAGGTFSSGRASAVLTVERDFLTKAFIDDPIAPGGTGKLRFTLTNHDRTSAATGISFTDDLDATLAGLVATALPGADPCGAGSSLTGTSMLVFTGGSLPPEGTCAFDVTISVPAGTAPASKLNTTSSVNATIGGEPVVKIPAKDTLVISPAPRLTKEFTNDPVASGGNVTLRFTVTNTDTTGAATGIAFTDELTTFLPFPVAATLPAMGFCGAGSTIALQFFTTDGQRLAVSGGSLAAGASCSFDVGITIPAGFPSGTYANTTSQITATVAGATRTGLPATDVLEVIAPPQLTKSFVDDPVAPGGTVTLQFTLTHPATAPGNATAIAFTDDLAATVPALAGLTANLPVAPDPPCGAGSTLTAGAGNTLLTFAGGSLAPGATCSFAVTLNVPAGAAGNYTNTSSNVTATVSGVPATGNPASDVLNVGGLRISKSFTDDPVAPNAPVTLQYTIENLFADPATSVGFTDNLGAALTGLAATGLPANGFCGASSALTGTGTLTLANASLAGGASCTFSATLLVPPGAAAGEYVSNSSAVTGLVTIPRTGNSAGDKLLVVNPAPNLPDLLASKTNSVGGATSVGTTWQWRATVSNAGDGVASFTAGQAIFSDTLPRVNMTYGSPSIGSSSGVTGTVNCALSGDNQVNCTASGAVSIAAGGSFRVDIPSTASATGTFTNPTGGTARADPANSVSESNETNNDGNSDSVVVTIPDLVVSKANTVGGTTPVGTTWSWRSTISNVGTGPANFAGGQTIYTDTMPGANVAYGAPSIGSSTGLTGTIDCALSGANVVLCTASGAVTLSAGGSVRVDVTATPSAVGTFTNPAGGPARVDPNNSVVESNEANNDSNSDSVVVGLMLAPASLDFGGQSINTTSPAMAVTLSNPGATPLAVSSVTVSTYYALTHDCTSVAAAGSCTINVTFTPSTEGALNGTLTVQTAAGTQTVSLTGVGERSLVTHYYYSILRRAPDAGGKAFWEGEAARMQSLGVNVNETWYSMASAFYTSPEYLAFNRDNTGFVTDLYRTFFNRDPDAPGLAYWKGLLDQGMPREVMLASFMFSAEFVNFTQAIFGTAAVRKEIDMVVDFYRGLLARLPDNSGFAFWLQKFRAAQCQGASAVIAEVEAISSQFATGAEYAARARNNSQYVGDLYNAFLRRGGDLPGVQFWINQIATSAQTREQVRQQFVAGPEEFQVRVQAIISEGCLP